MLTPKNTEVLYAEPPAILRYKEWVGKEAVSKCVDSAYTTREHISLPTSWDGIAKVRETPVEFSRQPICYCVKNRLDRFVRPLTIGGVRVS